MLKVKVWCLPNDSEIVLNSLYKSIVEALVSIPELSIKGEEDILCLFPPDLMKYGLGEEISIEINGLPFMFSKNEPVCERIAKCVGKSVSAIYPKARVECSVEEFNAYKKVWDSEKSKKER